jgi:hypothetical protein
MTKGLKVERHMVFGPFSRVYSIAQARRLHLALCAALQLAFLLQTFPEFSMLMFYVPMISCHLAGELCSHAYKKCKASSTPFAKSHIRIRDLVA